MSGILTRCGCRRDFVCGSCLKCGRCCHCAGGNIISVNSREAAERDRDLTREQRNVPNGGVLPVSAGSGQTGEHREVVPRVGRRAGTGDGGQRDG